MTPDDFTKMKAIEMLKSRVLSRPELSRELTKLAFNLDWKTTLNHAQKLSTDRLKSFYS